MQELYVCIYVIHEDVFVNVKFTDKDDLQLKPQTIRRKHILITLLSIMALGYKSMQAEETDFLHNPQKINNHMIGSHDSGRLNYKVEFGQVMGVLLIIIEESLQSGKNWG